MLEVILLLNTIETSVDLKFLRDFPSQRIRTLKTPLVL